MMNMVTRQHVFAPGEWYHCYSRGVEKRTVFETKTDYERFTGLLYIANARPTIHRSNLGKRTLGEILDMPREETLTAIGAYCLMPNHIHLLLKETDEGGISRFMLKLMTAYSMYFNIRHEHEGNLFTHPFRSRHVGTDRYFQRMVDYIHCNPAELFEPGWKSGKVQSIGTLHKKLLAYPYSSLESFYDTHNVKRAILAPDIFNAFEIRPPIEMVRNALRIYHEED
jgi:REP element-mobilizing transposase RayT